MRRLSKTGRQIHELIEALNASAERTEVFAEACERLERVIGFNSAILLPHGPENFSFLQDGHLVLNARTRDSRAYTEHYVHYDPLYTEWVAKPVNLNKAARNTDLVSAQRLLDSEFVQDFMNKVPALYVVGGLLAHRNEVVGAFAIHRSRRDRDFSDHDKDIMNCLFPFLARTFYAIEHPHARGRNHAALLELTPREDEVLHHVLSGQSYRVIAESLHLHIQTVKKHMQNILAKAEVRNRYELMVRLAGLEWQKDENDPRSEILKPGQRNFKKE